MCNFWRHQCRRLLQRPRLGNLFLLERCMVPCEEYDVPIFLHEHLGCGIGWMNARDQKNNSTVNVIVSSTCATTDNQVHIKSRSAIVMVSDTLITKYGRTSQ
ncbi:hypothetical protein BDQ94DRAFT_138636 [Aspergillus welwitschiae]|uniref:Uncharacterized protein n=1 Tax=Aspergillus welwitschiae TaxID=1341132 RepID=A0A3F3QAA6_9EURO|nr:hypothetical protein BDQ94DRAFT_138636 [Aspergillus welwitschiae]RDH36140.1 hypothetical protein BDQ94DRAFT_138636 [Aspergillus welwitschiae]